MSKLRRNATGDQDVRTLDRRVEDLSVPVVRWAVGAALGGRLNVSTDQKLPGSHDGKTLESGGRFECNNGRPMVPMPKVMFSLMPL